MGTTITYRSHDITLTKDGLVVDGAKSPTYPSLGQAKDAVDEKIGDAAAAAAARAARDPKVKPVKPVLGVQMHHFRYDREGNPIFEPITVTSAVSHSYDLSVYFRDSGGKSQQCKDRDIYAFESDDEMAEMVRLRGVSAESTRVYNKLSAESRVRTNYVHEEGVWFARVTNTRSNAVLVSVPYTLELTEHGLVCPEWLPDKTFDAVLLAHREVVAEVARKHGFVRTDSGEWFHADTVDAVESARKVSDESRNAHLAAAAVPRRRAMLILNKFASDLETYRAELDRWKRAS